LLKKHLLLKKLRMLKKRRRKTNSTIIYILQRAPLGALCVFWVYKLCVIEVNLLRPKR
jgi:hypothetical protein